MTTEREPVGSPIERYLDQLVRLSGTRHPRRLRHLLLEVEEHLRDEAAAGLALGKSQTDAEADAVARFGSAAELVTAERRSERIPLIALVRQFVSSGLLLGALGAIAVGISGLLAGVVGWVAGTTTVVDVPPGQMLSPADCGRWLAGDPAAGGCRQAAVADWFGEIVWYRVFLGVIGAVGLVLLLVLRHAGGTGRRWNGLPGAVESTIGVTCFGLAAAWTASMGVITILQNGGTGWAQWLCPAAVAATRRGCPGCSLGRPTQIPGHRHTHRPGGARGDAVRFSGAQGGGLAARLAWRRSRRPATCGSHCRTRSRRLLL